MDGCHTYLNDPFPVLVILLLHSVHILLFWDLLPISCQYQLDLLSFIYCDWVQSCPVDLVNQICYIMSPEIRPQQLKMIETLAKQKGYVFADNSLLVETSLFKLQCNSTTAECMELVPIQYPIVAIHQDMWHTLISTYDLSPSLSNFLWSAYSQRPACPSCTVFPHFSSHLSAISFWSMTWHLSSGKRNRFL